MKASKEKKTKSNPKMESVKSFLIVFLAVLVFFLMKEVFSNKYMQMENHLILDYYSSDHLYEAMKDTLNDFADASDNKKKYIMKNFDNYVFNLVLSDLNNQEDEHKAKYNLYYNKENAEKIMNQIDSSENVVVNEEGGICYVKINDFTRHCTYKDLTQYKNVFSKNKDYVIDLRGNSGGSIDELIDILSLFYPHDSIVFTKIISGETKEFKTTKKKIIEFDKLVFLCDESTASAAEVMIFNLKSDFKDHVEIVGSKTYGKNFECAYRQFKDGELLMFVSGLMGNSKGETFDENGIVPDHEMDASADPLAYAKELF